MLAEISIPHIWSFRAVLSLVGLLYMVICFLLVGVKGGRGWGIVTTLTCIGLVIVVIFSPDPMMRSSDGLRCFTHRVVTEDGSRSIDRVDAIPFTCGGPQRIFYVVDGIKYEEEPVIFAMHDPHVSYCFKISPWVFHPACLVWSPGIIMVFTALIWFTGSDK